MTPEITFMSNTHRQSSLGQRQKHNQFPTKPFAFRLSPIAAVIAGICFTSAAPLYAADDNAFSELQAENARLKQALEKSQRELAAEKSVHAPAPAEIASKPSDAPTGGDKKETIAQAEQPVALDAVVVRARNRIERLQDVPLSVSVVTGKELDRLEATDLGSITKRAANVAWNQGNQRTSSVSIRGLGKVGQTEAQDPSVGIIVDGVNYAYNPLTSSYAFTDVDTVEVTRGPQGTLLGKNTSLGVINVTTRRPSFTPSADYSVTLGERDHIIGSFAGGGPVVDDLLAWRGTFVADKGRGDIRNIYNPDSTYQNTDRVSGRVQFLLTPSQDFSARLALDLTPRAGENTNGRTFYTPTPTTLANGGVTSTSSDAKTRLTRDWFTQNTQYSYLNNYLYGNGSNNIYNESQQPVTTGSKGASVELNWNLGSHNLTSITAYKDYRFNAHNNDEGTPFAIQTSSGQEIDYTQVSQEFRLSSKPGGFVDYQTGIFLLGTDTDIRRNVIYGVDAGAYYASTTQYNALADAAGRLLLTNSLDGLWKNENKQAIKNKSAALFGQANWHFSDQLTLTTGARFTNEDRQNPGSSLIFNDGKGGGLNPSVINGVRFANGFDSYYNTASSASVPTSLPVASAAYTAWSRTYNTYLLGNVVVAKGTAGATFTDTVYVTNGNKVAIGTNISTASATPGASDITIVSSGSSALTTDLAHYTTALANANALAAKYFGATKSWDGSVTGTTALSANQQKQVAYAQALRKGQVGVLWNTFSPETFKKTQPAFVVSPSYKVNDNLTTYASWQYGEKAGISQITNGISTPAKAEKSNSFELGFKSALLDKTLIFNADIYVTNIKDYQQAVLVYDAYSSGLKGQDTYVSATGNVPKVQAQGVEIDGVYAGIRNTSIRFSGAYNKAIYKSFPNSAQPVENAWDGVAPYRDVSGQAVAGAPKFTFNIGADYRVPVYNDKLFHTSFNTAYTGRYNSDTALSTYGWIPSNYITDFSIGLGTRNQSADFSLLVKNLFDDKTPLTQTWNSYTPAVPRWVGLVFSGKL
jgi:outer membrane receptor protein involved in Fe transport